MNCIHSRDNKNKMAKHALDQIETVDFIHSIICTNKKAI